LNGVENKITLSGHTDASVYNNGGKGYSNWELSADRANASRRELIAGGMDEGKLLRVVGLASASLYDKENPYDPSNRRISIIVMNKEAEESFMKDSDAVSVSNDVSEDALSQIQEKSSENHVDATQETEQSDDANDEAQVGEEAEAVSMAEELEAAVDAAHH